MEASHYLPSQQQQASSGTRSKVRGLVPTLMIIYLLLLGWILLLKLGFRLPDVGRRSVNLVPFAEPMMLNGRPDMGEIIINVILFLPLGIYAGMLFTRRRLAGHLLFFAAISFSIEALQYVLAAGAFDITDIITNTLGGLLGLGLIKGLESISRNRDRTHTIVTLLAAVSTIIIISLLVMLKLNLLPVKYQ